MTSHLSQPEPTRVFIVDDHPLVRTGLKQLIGQDPGLAICGEAETVKQAIDGIARHRPQVVLVDLALPGINGMELIKHLKQNWLGIKVIVLSTYDASVYGPLARRCGADRYLNKHEAMDQVIRAIHDVTHDPADQNRSQTYSSPWFG